MLSTFPVTHELLERKGYKVGSQTEGIVVRGKMLGHVSNLAISLMRVNEISLKVFPSSETKDGFQMHDKYKQAEWDVSKK